MGGETVFIVGPGYIGQNIVERLIKEDYQVTGLVRRQEHAAIIKSFGATPVLGDLNNKALITKLTASHDITFHTATADHPTSVEAILDGLRQRARTSKPCFYIHTSGTGVTNDDANGDFKSDKTYSDATRVDIDAISATAPHRDVDTTIVNAMAEPELKNAKMAIMLPPTIYGINPAHKRLSIQIPYLTRWALKHGYAGHVGKGMSVESQIHVLDLARGYMTMFHYMLDSPASAVHENPFFFCENGVESSWKEVSSEIGEQLYKVGKIGSPEPKTIPESLYGDLFGEGTASTIGLNSRSRAKRLRSLGWQPREKGWREAFREDELPLVLAEGKA